jgi:hypothetical protein
VEAGHVPYDVDERTLRWKATVDGDGGKARGL